MKKYTPEFSGVFCYIGVIITVRFYLFLSERMVTVTSPSGPLVAMNSSPEPGVITSVLERTPAGASEFMKPKKLFCTGAVFIGGFGSFQPETPAP